jgi:hypothetical protein
VCHTDSAAARDVLVPLGIRLCRLRRTQPIEAEAVTPVVTSLPGSWLWRHPARSADGRRKGQKRQRRGRCRCFGLMEYDTEEGWRPSAQCRR